MVIRIEGSGDVVFFLGLGAYIVRTCLMIRWYLRKLRNNVTDIQL